MLRGYYQNIGNDSVKMDFNPDFLASVSVSRAALDADTCITCFCCQEICPEKAISLR